MGEVIRGGDLSGLERAEAGRERRMAPLIQRRASPTLLQAVSSHMGQPWVSPDEVLATLRDEYALRVYEDGLLDSDESWESFLAHWAAWAQGKPASH
jgi:hypothetical protein